MDYNEQTTETVLTEKKSKLPLIVLLMTALVLGALVFVFFSTVNQNETQLPVQETPVETEKFMLDISTYGELMSNGEFAEALSVAEQLLENSTSDLERGRANLSVALAERQFDQLAALERFKNISQTETYHPFVRAIAMWHALEPYYANRDVDYARDHIFTGGTWSSYIDPAYTGNDELMYRLASISALRAATDVAIVAQATMRLAVEYSSLFQYDEFSDVYKAEVANAVQQYITLAEQDLVEIRNQNIPHYAGTEYVVEAGVLNNKALALDALYVGGYITDPSLVAEAYEEALEAAIAYDLQTSHPQFIRYNYADFLYRTDQENSSTTIAQLLLPMTELTTDSTFAGYVWNRLTLDGVYSKSERYTGHPATMRQLANMSPEFRAGLLQIGLTDAELSLASSVEVDSNLLSSPLQ